MAKFAKPERNDKIGVNLKLVDTTEQETEKDPIIHIKPEATSASYEAIRTQLINITTLQKSTNLKSLFSAGQFICESISARFTNRVLVEMNLKVFPLFNVNVHNVTIGPNDTLRSASLLGNALDRTSYVIYLVWVRPNSPAYLYNSLPYLPPSLSLVPRNYVTPNGRQLLRTPKENPFEGDHVKDLQQVFDLERESITASLLTENTNALELHNRLVQQLTNADMNEFLNQPIGDPELEGEEEGEDEGERSLSSLTSQRGIAPAPAPKRTKIDENVPVQESVTFGLTTEEQLAAFSLSNLNTVAQVPADLDLLTENRLYTLPYLKSVDHMEHNIVKIETGAVQWIGEFMLKGKWNDKFTISAPMSGDDWQLAVCVRATGSTPVSVQGHMTTHVLNNMEVNTYSSVGFPVTNSGQV